MNKNYKKMKKQVLTFIMALIAVASLHAQQISVVSSSGSTSVYSTLQEAIEGATSGSVIYLPGGGFSISDEVKITKQVTIIGIGYKSSDSNVDGTTIINGNLWFNQGSSGSAVMGCYISGNVNIGEDGVVDNLLVKLSQLGGVSVKNSECSGTVVNQCYLGYSDFGSSTDVTVSNSVTSGIANVNSGTIKNNVICYSNGVWAYTSHYSLSNVNYAIINNNIIRRENGYIYRGSNCQTSNNCLDNGSWGDDPIIIDAAIDEVFVNLNGWNVSPLSDFHFTDAYSQYESQVGIYAGTGFSDAALPPTPYIVGKEISGSTDSEGKLHIKVRVKASE